MPVTTQDCKDFIKEISDKINAVSADWKRTKKYKNGSLVFRDFESDTGQKLTLAEQDGKVFLYSLQESCVVGAVHQFIQVGQKSIGRKATNQDVFIFISECVQKDNSVVYAEDVTDAIDVKSWTCFYTWTRKKSDDYSVFPLADFFEDNSGDTRLFYSDGIATEVKQKDILEIYWVGMREYDTAYRIYIFETKDNKLLLGCNNPD